MKDASRSDPVLSDDEVVRIFEEVVDRINQDPKTKELGEELQRRMGTLQDGDLQKTYTV